MSGIPAEIQRLYLKCWNLKTNGREQRKLIRSIQIRKEAIGGHPAQAGAVCDLEALTGQSMTVTMFLCDLTGWHNLYYRLV